MGAFTLQLSERTPHLSDRLKSKHDVGTISGTAGRDETKML